MASQFVGARKALVAAGMVTGVRFFASVGANVAGLFESKRGEKEAGQESCFEALLP